MPFKDVIFVVAPRNYWDYLNRVYDNTSFYLKDLEQSVHQGIRMAGKSLVMELIQSKATWQHIFPSQIMIDLWPKPRREA